MQFVNEKNNLAFSGDDLFEHGLEPVFEFTSKFRARYQRPHINRNNSFILQAGGDITCDYPLRKPFDDCGLAHSRLTDQNRIVLRPAIEDLHTPPDFLVPADDRIELFLPGHLQKVNAVPLKGLVFAFWTLVRYLFTTADLLQRAFNLFGHNRIKP